MKAMVCAGACLFMSVFALFAGRDPSPWGAAALVIAALYQDKA